MSKKEKGATAPAEAPAENSGLVSKRTKHQVEGVEIEHTFDFGADLAASVEKFGEKIVHDYFVIGAGKALRDKLNALAHGKDPEKIPSSAAIREQMGSWTLAAPSRGGRKKSAMEKATEAAASMSPEELAAFIKQLEARSA